MDNIDINSSFEVVNTSTSMTPMAVQFDPAKYAAEVDAFDITDAQKQELLQTLWSIMRSFVELGFTVDLCTALSDDVAVIPIDTELR